MAASGLSGQGTVDKMAKDLGKIVSITRKVSDAKKYGAILDWIESHCCREDSYIYHWWRALDHEDYLYDEINKQLERKSWNIKTLLVKLEYTLMFQHGLMAPIPRDIIIADMKTVFEVDHELATFLTNKIETLKPAEGHGYPSERDLLPAFTLSVVKLIAFASGRSLLGALIANLGTKKILLHWGEAFAGFPGKRSPRGDVTDATTHSATMNLGPAKTPQQLELQFRTAGSKAFLDRCSNLYKGCIRGTCSDLQLLCLALPGGMYAWHHVFAGVKPGPVSKSRFVNFISPHYCQVYHEGCHWIRTLAGKAFSVKPEHTQVILCPTLITCYENAEEFFNIRGAEHSEGALLREMGYPERLSHTGGIVPSGNAGTAIDANYSADYGRGDAILSLAKGLLEYRLLTQEAYDRIDQKPPRQRIYP
jgi:hypothetical protein